MRQAQLFLKTRKEAPKEAITISHKLLVRANFIDQLASGIWSFLPLGWRVHQKIENIIREEMNKIDGQEVFLPTLQPKTLWEETERWEKIDPPLFKVKDRHKREYGLGSTHEEVITHLARKNIRSYKDLPLALYQIQTKFRNELRATSGLLRTREFIMKDLYSFHKDKKDLDKYYQKVSKAYQRIYSRCELKAVKVEASSGTIGGSISHEFMVLAETGEDKVLICEKCNWAINIEIGNQKKVCPKCKTKLSQKSCIEAGHIFKLETKYSQVMKAFFVDKSGQEKPIIMGCYGIGLGRLMATIVETHHDKDGIIWPASVAPYQIHLLCLGLVKSIKKQSDSLFGTLQKSGFEALYDNRNEPAAIKLKDADLIGIPIRLIISEKTKKKVEFKKRNSGKIQMLEMNKLIPFLKRQV